MSAWRRAWRPAWRGLRWAVRTEVRMYVGLLRLLARRTDVPAGATAHGYAGAVSLLLWCITIVSLVELVALHLILSRWSGWVETVRLLADVVGIWGAVWCAGLTACHYVYPHLVTPDGLRVRAAGPRDVVLVPWSAVASAAVRERSLESTRAVQLSDVGDTRVLHVVVASRTALDVRLRHPVAVRVRGTDELVSEVRLYADEAREVAQAIRARTDRGAPNPS